MRFYIITEVITVLLRTDRIISNSFRNYLNNTTGNHEIKALQNSHTGRVETESGGTRKRTVGEVKGKKANGGGSQQPCPVSDTVYPALLPPMRILRLPAAD